jgi:hypothetical protein
VSQRRRLTGLSGLSSRIGAEPAMSALSLRLALALFGFVVCLVGAIVAFVLGVTGFGIVLLVAALIGLVDAIVVIVRRRHGTAPII